MMLYLALSSLLVFLFTIAENYDTRRPISSKLRQKFRVKDDSFLRKIIKFKDKKHYPCNYFKIIPIYIYLFLSLTNLIFFLIDVLSNGGISKLIPDSIYIYISISIFCLYILYFIIITIWWEIVDYKEMKFTKKEKEELKHLRRLRKQSKK